MTNSWNDFNDARQNANLIPKGTIAKVRLTIRPGGHNDPAEGWTGGYAKKGITGSVYLDAEYTVLEGPYAKRKVWSMIGLYSTKGPDWGNMGRALIRGILNSARGLVRQGQLSLRRRMPGAFPASPISMASSSWPASTSAPTPMARTRTTFAQR